MTSHELLLLSQRDRGDHEVMGRQSAVEERQCQAMTLGRTVLLIQNNHRRRLTFSNGTVEEDEQR